MGWGKYKPIFCRIYAEGRESDPSFGSEGFEMHIRIGHSIKKSHEFAKIQVIQNSETGETKLIVNNKIIIEEYV